MIENYRSGLSGKFMANPEINGLDAIGFTPDIELASCS